MLVGVVGVSTAPAFAFGENGTTDCLTPQQAVDLANLGIPLTLPLCEEEPQPVPEPGTTVGLAVLGLGAIAAKRRQNHQAS